MKLYQAKEKAVNQQLSLVENLSSEMDDIKKRFNDAKKKLTEIKEMPVDEFGQQSLFTEDQQKGIAA